MRLFVQIPCLNEEKTLPSVIAGIPKKIDHVDEVCILVVDDGSTDNTVEVARQLGVDYIIKNSSNLGLAKSFDKGLEACLFAGADIIVNTDGDNQYKGEDIPKLIRPILEDRADVVIGCRDISGQKEFSFIKKYLQKLGSNLARKVSNTHVPDATSGFRAINRKAAINFSFMTRFSYTLEMLIQAGRTGLEVSWVDISTNPKTRPSRLFRSNINFIYEQLKTIFVIYLFYCPMRFFNRLASISLFVSILMALRISYFLWLSDPSNMKFKSGSGVLLLFSSIITVLLYTTGLIGSVLSGLRFLMLDIRFRIRNMELQRKVLPGDFKPKETKGPSRDTRQ